MIYQDNFFRIVFALHLLLSSVSCHHSNQSEAFQAGDLILGGLFPVHSYCPNTCHDKCGDLRSNDAVYFTEAMIYAIDEANRNPNILPGISLGFRIMDYCSKDVVALEKASNFLPSCSMSLMSQSPPIVGVVGPYSSSVSLQVSNLLGLFKVPHISYGATSPLLSDKNRFKYFLRTVPSDEVRAQALVDLLLLNETKYVSVVYSDDEFGREGSKYFTQEAEKRGICIGTTKALQQDETVSTLDEIVKEISQKINAKVVVLFCSKRDISLLFNAVKRLGKQNDFRWLVGGDSSEMSVYLKENEDMANYMVLCSPRNEKVKHFEKWRNRNNASRNPWISEVRLQTNKTKQPPENEEESSTADTYIQSVINSVLTFAHALDKIYKISCKNISNPISCLQGESQQRKILLDTILGITFEISNGRKIEFDKNGDISAEYDLLRPQKDDHGTSWRLVKLGRWGPKTNGSGPVTMQLFENTNILPQTYCSRPCKAGERKIPIKVCCWRCDPCKVNEITNSKQTECTACVRGYMPDINKTNCLPLPVVYVDPSPSLILFTMSFSASGLVCTLLILILFVTRKDHPVIKASSRGLSCVLLLGILISYGENFLDLISPDYRVCSLRGYTCLGHVTCYAVMFSKTLRVNRLFNSSLRKTMNPTFVSTRSQLGLIGFILGLSVAFSTVWGFYKYQESVLRIYTAEEIIVQCSVTDECVLITNLYYLTLLALCSVYTFKTRKLPKQFRETKGLALAMYLAATLHLIVLAIVCTMDEQNLIRGRAVRLSHPLVASAVLFPLFLPKLYRVIFHKERMVNNIQRAKEPAENVAKDYTDGLWLRIGQSNPDLLRRRSEGTNKIPLGELPEGSNRSHAESLATISEDSRSRTTSTDTLRSNFGLLDRCRSTSELNRRGEGDTPRNTDNNNFNHSIYSTWL